MQQRRSSGRRHSNCDSIRVMNDAEKPSRTARASRQEAKDASGHAHPLQSNLDHFIARVDSLADHTTLAIAAIVQSHKQESAKFSDFMMTVAKPVEGGENAFTVPEGQFTAFRRLRRRFLRSRHALISVRRSFIVALVSDFDSFMSATLKAFYHLRPEALNASERTMTYSELVAFDSIEAAREYIVEKDVESFLRSSHSEQFRTLESKLDIHLRKDLAVWKDFIELTERRNLFVHNDAIVNERYLQVCSSEGYDCSDTKKGKVLGVSKNYFSKAHNVVYELAAKLSHVLWRKLSPEDRERADAHFAGTLIYDLLDEKRYRLARTLADFGASTFKKWGSDYFRRALVVNRAQAYLWDGKRDEAQRVLDAEDWSAVNDEFQVCVASLRNNIPEVIRFIKALGPSSRPGKDGYRGWPVFRELRKTKEFHEAFLDVFGEPLATVTVDGVDSPSLSGASAPTSSALAHGPNDGDDKPSKVH